MTLQSNNHKGQTTRLVTFDWDQTLWNSWDVHIRGARRAAEELGLEVPSEEHIAANYSVPFVKHMGLLFPHNTKEATRIYMDFYHSQVSRYAHLFPGVADMLAGLQGAGYRLALLSDKRQRYGKEELGTTPIRDMFDYVLFLDRRRAYKPNPAGLRQVMEALSVLPEQVMYVGDSYVDIQCAHRCGVVSTAALWGSLNVEAVLQQSPTYICHTIPELVETLATQVDWQTREGSTR